jgi:hypothetical protein
VLTLARSYTQNSGSVLRIEIGGLTAGTQYDRLVVSNTATLGGSLTVVLTNGFVPSAGNSFVVLQAASLGGTKFAATNLPAIGTNLWTVTYAANTAVVLSVSSPPSGYDAYALQITNGLAAQQQDADGDGYANLLEYVTGGNPTNADSAARLNATSTNGVFALRFTRNTNSVDATLIVEGTYAPTNNAEWTGFATNRAGSWGGNTNVIEGAGSPATVTAFDSSPATSNRFLRLRVTRP